jgi:hypothetical protein
MDEIVIKNKTIIDFYNQYDTLNIEEVNLWIISMFEKIKNNVTGKIDNSLLNDILNKIQQTSTNTEIAMNHIENMKEVHKLSNDKYSSEMGNIQIILKQVMDSVTHHNLNLKTDISNSISTILKNNINNGVSDEVIKSLNGTLESQLNSYLDKTKIFYMENLPNIISTNNEPIVKTLNASEERIQNCISEIKEKSTITNENTIELKQSINDHILNTKTSSKKGDLSENKLLPILNNIFPTDEVIHNGSGKHSHCCDYSVIRNNNKNILIENKDYNVNIGPDNIRKFIDDIERNNAHGIFLSQHSGITGKSNYKIDIHKNNVLVYIHDVNYDSSKIKAAVEMIDRLSDRLCEIDMDENSISKDDLDTINTEFNNFVEAKEDMIKMVSEFQKRIIQSIKQINLSCLEKYLNNKFAHMKTFNFVCEYCNKGWDTRRALAAHKKGCIKHFQSLSSSTEICIDT